MFIANYPLVVALHRNRDHTKVLGHFDSLSSPVEPLYHRNGPFRLEIAFQSGFNDLLWTIKAVKIEVVAWPSTTEILVHQCECRRMNPFGHSQSLGESTHKLSL